MPTVEIDITQDQVDALARGEEITVSPDPKFQCLACAAARHKRHVDRAWAQRPEAMAEVKTQLAQAEAAEAKARTAVAASRLALRRVLDSVKP